MSNPANIPALLRTACPVVKIENGQAVTTSLEVARVFGKQHKDVLRAIQNLCADLPENNQRNFAPVDCEDGKGESRPAYHLTRDGFTLLAMGFTDKKALAFKLAYIEAFNQMEAALTGQPLPPPVPTKTLTFTVPQDETRNVRWLLDIDRQGNERARGCTRLEI